MQHVCGPKGPKWTSPCNGILPTGYGEEVASPDGGEGTVGDREGYHILWVPTRPGHLLQVPGAGSCGRGQRLAGDGPQPTLC